MESRAFINSKSFINTSGLLLRAPVAPPRASTPALPLLQLRHDCLLHLVVLRVELRRNDSAWGSVNGRRRLPLLAQLQDPRVLPRLQDPARKRATAAKASRQQSRRAAPFVAAPELLEKRPCHRHPSHCRRRACTYGSSW